jgi:1,4-alpha-glucan branching enzyme
MPAVKAHSLFTDFDIALFKSGKHFKLYEKFGAHSIELENEAGVYFAVWAPSANSVSVIGDFNFWDKNAHPLNVRWDSSGIWEGFIPDAAHGMRYKFSIQSSADTPAIEKIDPFARYFEKPPLTGSIIWDGDDYSWKDKDWMSYRKDKNDLDRPYSVYEVHLASWRRNEQGEYLSYREMTDQLVSYVKDMNFTHVELMPVMEYPFDPSWGYQLLGYFATTSRFGSPEEFMALVDAFHQNDIGVILDWVPSHFPSDAHGLGDYDGTHLYEHPDRKKGYHPDWKSLVFNYERNEVRSFLISNAFYWLERFHVDGLRVDAVASMLYLDYSREEGEWEPNEFGGNENLAASSFLRDFNHAVYENFEGVQTIAEESTAFPMVTRPIESGGLGFGMKWMMGWMNDTLEYFSKDPVYRSHHQNEVTQSMTYVFSENFMLPLSHDEVVHGKHSLLGRMPGDEWQRFSNLRLMYGYMFTHPGTKLLFQGAEFGQYDEWNFDKGLDWNLLDFTPHQQMQSFVRDLNALYRTHPALYEKGFGPEGFEWIDHNDHHHSVISYIRKGHDAINDLVVVCNFTPSVIRDYRIGLSVMGVLEEIFSSDAPLYGGSGVLNGSHVQVEETPWNNRDCSCILNVAPLAVMVFKYHDLK